MKAKKRLGQHFLTDGGVCRRIVQSAGLSDQDVVLEIGPGHGALTGILLDHAAKVIAVELDETLVDELTSRFPSDKLRLIAGDILKTNIAQLFDDEKVAGPVRVFGNLPYNIATAVIQRLTDFRHRIADMTVMLQREVVDRILSAPSSKQYGYLSLVVQYYCEAVRLFNVAPGSFRPVPKVTSTVMRLKFHDGPPVQLTDEAFFFTLVSAAFAERRKTIQNNLKHAAARLKLNDVEASLHELGFDPNRRAETFSLAEFARLANGLIAHRS
jgi:16S rRNA (adenine1518-N6/adenine1519-N6)-dimethyltransferase